MNRLLATLFCLISLSSTAFAQLQEFTITYHETAARRHVRQMAEVVYQIAGGKQDAKPSLISTADWDSAHRILHAANYGDGQKLSEYRIRWTDSSRSIGYTNGISKHSVLTNVVYTRDAKGQVIRESFFGAESDFQSAEYYFYDPLGRLRATAERSASGDSLPLTELTYDRDTVLETIIEGDSRISFREIRDAEGNTLSKETLGEDGSVRERLVSKYEDGLLKEATDYDATGSPSEHYELRYTFY